MIRAAIASDPQTARGYSNNPEFAVTRVFGMDPRKAG
jgi:hypothetical protein